MTRARYYRLDANHEPQPFASMASLSAADLEYLWSEEHRRVGDDEIGPYRVSTVFLVIDHQFGNGPPLLFETMVFGPQEGEYQTRCSTWAEAVSQHAEAVRHCEMKMEASRDRSTTES